MTAAVVGLGLVVALLAILVVGLLRSHAEILRALHQLGVGDDQLRGEAPIDRRSSGPGIRTVAGVPEPGAVSALGRLHDISGLTPDGGAARVGLDGSPGMTLLAFLSSGCTTCHDFWRAFGTEEVRRAPGGSTRVVVVTQGPESESPAEVASLAPAGITTVMSSAAWDDYEVPISPYFLLVDGRTGVIGEGAAASWAQVVDLLEKALADAGVAERGATGPSRRQLLSGRHREERADRELADAGIEPGSPSLYAPVEAVDAPQGEEAKR